MSESSNYPDKQDWDEFFRREYDALLKIARRHTRDHHDLVHHCYQRCLTNPFPENPMGYAVVAMFREVTRGKFKRLYQIEDHPDASEVPHLEDMTKSIQREQMQLVIDRLSWFDRTLMNLYLEGWSMVEVAEGTDIAVNALYQSLHRSRKTIIHAIRNS